MQDIRGQLQVFKESYQDAKPTTNDTKIPPLVNSSEVKITYSVEIMAPTAVESSSPHPSIAHLTGDERALALKAKSADRPLDVFTYGGHPISGHQTKPIHQIRIPKFASLEDEREWRKLHHAAALRWLGVNGYNNEGAGGHVTVRDP